MGSGWPQTCSNHPVSASQMLRLQAYATTPGLSEYRSQHNHDFPHGLLRFPCSLSLHRYFYLPDQCYKPSFSSLNLPLGLQAAVVSSRMECRLCIWDKLRAGLHHIHIWFSQHPEQQELLSVHSGTAFEWIRREDGEGRPGCIEYTSIFPMVLSAVYPLPGPIASPTCSTHEDFPN